MSATTIRVFISAVSAEFRADRDALAGLLAEYGVAVSVQQSYPTALDSGRAIRAVIDASDMVVCLVGQEYGLALPPDNVPEGIPADASWTQWEYLHARAAVARDPAKRLVVFVDNAMAEGAHPGQAAFRATLLSAEMAAFGGLFVYPYPGRDILQAQFRRMLEDPAGGLAGLQYAYWAQVKDRYRASTRAAWAQAFPDTLTAGTGPEDQARMMHARTPPFVETQGFAILVPGEDGRQCRFLRPAAFLTGRDTETEARAREGADWVRLGPAGGSDRRALLAAVQGSAATAATLGGAALPAPVRLFIVCGSGVGKSTNLRWLEAHLAEPAGEAASRRLGLLVRAGALAEATSQTLADVLALQFVAAMPDLAGPWHSLAVAAGLRRDLADGGIVLLVDGLDHVGSDLPVLVESQAGAWWAACPVVAAGRPQALLGWEDHPDPARKMAASRWRFIEPAEFTDDEARLYLGQSGALSRFDAVREHLGGLVNVPRVLEYVRKLHAAELGRMHTGADVYAAALWHLVKETLVEGGAPARRCGPDWQDWAARREPPGEQVDYVIMLLAALAFMSLCRTVDPARPATSENTQMPINDARKKQLVERIELVGYKRMDLADINRDLTALGSLAGVVGNGVLEDLFAMHGARPLDSITWSNRSIQQFLAALWLAKYAAGLDALDAALDGGKVVPTAGAQHDAQRLRNYVHFPEADLPGQQWRVRGGPAVVPTDTTYELNLFLAEMPWSVINPPSWVASASVWFDPSLFGGPARTLRVWSTEMMFRAWSRMAHCACRDRGDWWDVPYDALALTPAPRGACFPAWDRLPDTIDPDDAAALTAQRVLDRFTGEFAAMLASPEGSVEGAAAREMVGADAWVSAPAGCFEMGRPADAEQGCTTAKVRAYWTALLDQVQAGTVSARAAAEAATWPEWFAGKLGAIGREFDVQWLEALFAPLADERSEAAYRTAMDAIETRFHAYDETPAENPQAVAAFELHRAPVLHRWFWLFAPGHRLAVQTYLAGLATPRGLDAPPAHPPDDHPVIYASWFDAWAFCQWAAWRDPVTDTPFGLRLPHEPEWEYAARWGQDAGGLPTLMPGTSRWWWGDDFYAAEHEPREEHLSTPHAHADGRPGQTRPPREACPNGLGLHDAIGNVWEWTATLYDARKEEETMRAEKSSLRYSRFEPRARAPVNGQRTMRGGLWYYLNILATATNRFRYVGNDRDFKIGFRVVREPRDEP